MAEAQPPVPAGFEWRQAPVGRILVSTTLASVADHLFSTCDAAPAGSTMPDYQAVAATLDVDEAHVVRVRQVHGCDVVVCHQDRTESPDREVDADAIVSTDPRRVPSVRVADCVPILIADRRQRAVAAVHAGWRGTAAGAVEAAVAALGREGIAPGDLVAAIGPSIGPCCYQVDATVRDVFSSRRERAEAWFTSDGPSRWRLDLWQANRDQLEACGVPAEQMAVAASCTAHDPTLWYSHRRQGPAAGRMVAAIRLGLNRRS